MPEIPDQKVRLNIPVKLNCLPETNGKDRLELRN